MVDEVKYSAFTSLGLVKDSCSLEEFVKLFANHRPVLGTDKASLEAAFDTLAAHAAAEAAKAAAAAAAEAAKKRGRRGVIPGTTAALGATAGTTATATGDAGTLAALGLSGLVKPGGAVDWAALKGLLLSGGEALGEDELSGCLEALVGIDDLPAGPITAEAFVAQVLGFEEDPGDEQKDF